MTALVPGIPDAVRKSIVVRCGIDAAFRTWTEQIDVWWPKKHSRSGDPLTAVFFERRLGGRIYERTSEGLEHDWGAVVAWEPPRHFAYHWYLGSGPAQPSLVEVLFTPQKDGSTLVNLTHRGPELIGDLWTRNNSIYAAAWENLLPAFIAACNINGGTK